jgi:hypothetical protein
VTVTDEVVDVAVLIALKLGLGGLGHVRDAVTAVGFARVAADQPDPPPVTPVNDASIPSDQAEEAIIPSTNAIAPM